MRSCLQITPLKLARVLAVLIGVAALAGCARLSASYLQCDPVVKTCFRGTTVDREYTLFVYGPMPQRSPVNPAAGWPR